MIFKLPDPPNTRDCTNQDDWGDILTIGKHLKRRDCKYPWKSDDFGIYLGSNKVGIIDIEGNVIEIINYNNLEKMKTIWILD